MNLKILMPFCLLIMLLSCKHKNKTISGNIAINDKKPTQIITQPDIAKLKYTDFILDTKAEKIIETWEAYTQLQQVIKNIKQADFSDLKNNTTILQTLITDLNKNIPPALKSPSIFARIMVLETKLFKLESLVNLSNINKKEVGNTIKELLIAFSNLNLQINKKIERDSQNIEKPF